jgi:hypothetical protein
MDDIKIEFGELYRLKQDSDYWIVNAQRTMRFTDGQPIIVKLEHSHLNKLFFGHLQDGGCEVEIEFGINDIVEKFDKEKHEKEEQKKRLNLIFLDYGVLNNFQDL